MNSISYKSSEQSKHVFYEIKSIFSVAKAVITVQNTNRAAVKLYKDALCFDDS